MSKILVVILGLFIFVNNANAFDCSFGSDEQCKLVNSQMKTVYNEALNFVKDKVKLETEQQEWEKSYLECKDDDCKNKSLSKRYLELSKIQIDGYDVIDKPLSEVETKQVCESIANLNDSYNANELKKFIVLDEMFDDNLYDAFSLSEKKLRYNLYFGKNNIKLFKNNWEKGTVYSVYKSKNKSGEEISSIDVVDNNDVIRWALYSGKEIFLLYKGRYYIIYSKRAKKGDVLTKMYMLSLLSDLGEAKRPLCYVEEEPNHNVDRYISGYDVCKKFVNVSSKIAPISENENININGNLFGQNVQTISRYVFDIDNDGKKDNVIQTYYAWSGGSGADYYSIFVVDKDWSFDKNYKEIGTGEIHSNSFYEIDGINYIHVLDAPQKTVDFILKIDGDKSEKVCDFGNFSKTTVKEYFKKIEQ